MESWIFTSLWFVLWCWTVNLSLNALGYATLRFAWLRTRDRALDGREAFFDHKRFLGDSTTWGGLILVAILGLIGMNIWPGRYLLLLSFSVYAGHALGSFIKRRLELPRGAYLPFVDHGDYLITAGAVACALGIVSGWSIVFWIFFTIATTPLVTSAAFYLHLRRAPL
ncbi:MAG: hypothetical protein JWL75_541 [Parcubacteria group bacterium]|nr:hypothetical protein [Parcubacteria group bacterium]